MRALFSILLAVFLANYRAEAHEDRIREVPYIALIKSSKTHETWDGVIITEKHILTSASRVVRKKETELTVHAGTLSNDFETGSYHAVLKIIIHKKFDPADPRKLHDIALLVLKHPISIDETREAIPIIKNVEKFGADGVVMDYHSKTKSYIHRRFLFLPILKNMDCNRAVDQTVVKKSQICAGFINGQGTCVGNFSGPLFVNRELAGIFSYNLICNETTHLGIFTDLALHHDWIAKYTGID